MESNLPCPSPSRGDGKSIDGLNDPVAVAALAKCWAPIIFPLQKLFLVSGLISHFPRYFGTGPYGSVLWVAKLGWCGYMPESTNPITISSPALSKPPPVGHTPVGSPKNCGVCVVSFRTFQSLSTDFTPGARLKVSAYNIREIKKWNENAREQKNLRTTQKNCAK